MSLIKNVAQKFRGGGDAPLHYRVSFLRPPTVQGIFIDDMLKLIPIVCLASKPSAVRFNSIKILLHMHVRAHVRVFLLYFNRIDLNISV